MNGDPMKAFFVARDLVTGEQEDLNKSDTYTQITSAMSSYYKLTAGSFEVAKASVKDQTSSVPQQILSMDRIRQKY